MNDEQSFTYQGEKVDALPGYVYIGFCSNTEEGMALFREWKTLKVIGPKMVDEVDKRRKLVNLAVLEDEMDHPDKYETVKVPKIAPSAKTSKERPTGKEVEKRKELKEMKKAARSMDRKELLKMLREHVKPEASAPEAAEAAIVLPAALPKLGPKTDSDKVIFPHEILIEGNVTVTDIHDLSKKASVSGRYRAREIMDEVPKLVLDTDDPSPTLWGSSKSSWEQRERTKDQPHRSYNVIILWAPEKPAEMEK